MSATMPSFGIGILALPLRPLNSSISLSFLLPVRLNLRGGHKTVFGIQVQKVCVRGVGGEGLVE